MSRPNNHLIQKLNQLRDLEDIVLRRRDWRARLGKCFIVIGAALELFLVGGLMAAGRRIAGNRRHLVVVLEQQTSPLRLTFNGQSVS